MILTRFGCEDCSRLIRSLSGSSSGDVCGPSCSARCLAQVTLYSDCLVLPCCKDAPTQAEGQRTATAAAEVATSGRVVNEIRESQWGGGGSAPRSRRRSSGPPVHPEDRRPPGRRPAPAPELKGSVGEGPNHSNHSNHSNSFKIQEF